MFRVVLVSKQRSEVLVLEVRQIIVDVLEAGQYSYGRDGEGGGRMVLPYD